MFLTINSHVLYALDNTINPLKNKEIAVKIGSDNSSTLKRVKLLAKMGLINIIENENHAKYDRRFILSSEGIKLVKSMQRVIELEKTSVSPFRR